MLTSNSKINILASKNMKEVDFLKWFETGMKYTGFGEYFEGDKPLNIFAFINRLKRRDKRKTSLNLSSDLLIYFELQPA